MSYINYYNGENNLYSFEFDGLTKEESERIQAYLLQDSTFFIKDEDALKKISEEPIELFKCEPYTEGEIYIKRSNDNKDHFVLSGYSRSVNGDKEYEYNMSSNIYEGLNFIAFVNILENRKNNHCEFSSFSWIYEKAHDPNKLLRYDIKNGPIGRIDPTYDIVEYEIVDGFTIKSSPVETFNKNKKETKVKKI